MKFLPGERLDDARRELPEFGRRGAVGCGKREDAEVRIDYLDVAAEIGGQDWSKRLLQCGNPAHPHSYCYQVLQGIQKEADAPAMPSHGRTPRGGNR